MPFLSVVVPIYGVEQYLRECVDSIIEQTFEDIEIILVDDGSKDSCPSICDSYASNDKRIHVIHKKNGGLVSARKAGVQVAKGEYITFVDGDDSIEKDMYREMCSIAKQTEADMVVEGFQFIYPAKKEMWEDKVEPGLYHKQELREKIYPVMMCHGGSMVRNVAPAVWNKIFRKALIYNILMEMDESMKDGEDAAVTYPCLGQAESVFFHTKAHHYRYRMNPVSMSRSYNPDWVENASKYSRWLEKEVLRREEGLTESVYLEQFRMLYRYLDREFVFCKEQKENFCHRIRTVIEGTPMGNSLRQLKLKDMKLSFVEKIQYHAFKTGKYGLGGVICWCRNIYTKIMSR